MNNSNSIHNNSVNKSINKSNSDNDNKKFEPFEYQRSKTDQITR